MYFPDPDLNSGKLLFGLQIRSLCSPLGHCEIILLSTYYFISTYYNIFLLLVCPTSGFYSNFHVSYWSLSAAATDYSLFLGGGRVWGKQRDQIVFIFQHENIDAVNAGRHHVIHQVKCHIYGEKIL